MLPPPAPVVVVVQDFGGAMVPFAQRVDEYRCRRVRVRIEGACYSACTLVTALGRDVCVGPAATLGFHQAYIPGWIPGDASDRSEAGTALFMRAYPQKLRDWIAGQGGLGEQIIVLKGAALERLFRRCPSRRIRFR